MSRNIDRIEIIEGELYYKGKERGETTESTRAHEQESIQEDFLLTYSIDQVVLFFIILFTVVFYFTFKISKSYQSKIEKLEREKEDNLKKANQAWLNIQNKEKELRQREQNISQKQLSLKKQKEEIEERIIELDFANADLQERIETLQRLQKPQAEPTVNNKTDIARDSFSKDPVQAYITFEEYAGMPQPKRNQLALNRYHERRKTEEQIGRDYELYVSYQYRQKGYIVEEHGIANGVKDKGIDLLAMDGKEVLVVQCKYWASGKVIHENRIKQLAGSAEAYRRENNLSENQVIGVFITNITLSEDARQAASILGIQVKENNHIRKYPSIKCTARRSNNGILSKNYYLPFDPQYNQIKIEYQGDLWLNTVEEAENRGFRRNLH